jgi:sugar-specific transcriptional regulator TrmB
MTKPEINPKIVESIGLSENERAVFEVLLNQKLARNVSAIAKTARLPRTTVIYILRRLEQRKLAERVLHVKRLYWKYKRGLEFLIRRPVDVVLDENLVDD